MSTKPAIRSSTITALSHQFQDGRSHGDVGISQAILGDAVIPAVRGEYYAYAAEFTKARPLYALMKCKANKHRPLADVESLGREVNMLFVFDGSGRVQVCGIGVAHASGLLGDSVSKKSFGTTLIAPARITPGNFYELRSSRDANVLMRICREACSSCETTIALQLGSTVAVTTDEGKYGLFCVKGITRTSIEIDACHILL